MQPIKLFVKGMTFNIKDVLEQWGFSWHRNEKCWMAAFNQHSEVKLMKTKVLDLAAKKNLNVWCETEE